MKLTAIKTNRVRVTDNDLHKLIDRSVSNIPDGSILVVTSKIVAITEGRVVAKDKISKEELIKQEASYYLPMAQSRYSVTLTIKNKTLIPTAGIDESNADNHYVLWPADSQKTANKLRAYLREKYRLSKFGVIITDSKTTPLRRGTTGIALAHSGFSALKNYVGQPDIFGVPMKVTQASMIDGLAAAAVLVMGEGAEQTPLALIEELDFIDWQTDDPSQEELSQLAIDLNDDLYAQLLKGARWLPGDKK